MTTLVQGLTLVLTVGDVPLGQSNHFRLLFGEAPESTVIARTQISQWLCKLLIVGAVMDVTTARQATATLEDRAGKIRRLVDANILGIFTWNLEGAIVEANEAFARSWSGAQR